MMQSIRLRYIILLLAAALLVGALVGCAPKAEPSPAPSATPLVLQTQTPILTSTPASMLTPQPVPQIRYVFLFIGDGMGQNQVRAVSEALAAAGEDPLSFVSFPVQAQVHTSNVDGETTDSAAAATAIACGRKTLNGQLGLDKDKSRVESLAEWLRNAGRRIGILTTVSLDHATPGGFYAHVDSRRSYNAIADDLLASGFDFFAGGGFQSTRDLATLAPENGYALTHDLTQARALPAGGVIYTSPRYIGDFGMLPAIDGNERTGELASALGVCIDRLTGDEGFFTMIEGGRIDYFCHYHDAASYTAELLDMDAAIRTALAFCDAHPQETLILVTADHETGDLQLSNGDRTALLGQTISADTCDDTLVVACREDKRPFEEALPLFTEAFGLSALTETETAYLEEAYRHTIKNDLSTSKKKSLYGVYEAITSACCKVVSDRAGLTYRSGSHTAADVSLYALGVGSELFAGDYENSAIRERILAALEAYPIN